MGEGLERWLIRYENLLLGLIKDPDLGPSTHAVVYQPL